MTQPTPSDLERQARVRAQIEAEAETVRQEVEHRRYQTALAEAQAEVHEVHTYWLAQGNDSLVAAILTQATLDNLPEGV